MQYQLQNLQRIESKEYEEAIPKQNQVLYFGRLIWIVLTQVFVFGSLVVSIAKYVLRWCLSAL